MKDPYEKIIEELNGKDIEFKITKHEPVYTSVQAAKVRGESIDTGGKSLLLNDGKDFILAVLPGGKRLSTKKLKKILKARNIRFATPEEVIDVMGCEIGACNPLGGILGIRTFVDSSLLVNEEINFNPGLHDVTITIKSSDYMPISGGTLVDICE